MKLLSRAEEIVLLAILKLKDTAYGVSIKEQIERETENKWSFGSIYMPLNKLTRKGYVDKSMGQPLQERGGRSKCLYRVTEEGRSALLAIRRVQQTLWSNLPVDTLPGDE